MSAVQLLPNVEILSQNFRAGSATLDQVRGWALPPRHVLAMLMPNFFGNPAEHTVFDIMTGQNVLLNSPFNAQNPQGVYSTMWGIKNYVEGGAYLGILPLLLAIYAIVRGGYPQTRSHRWFFVFLAGVSLAFMFGTPLYAILYYGLPGINQLHSPFRWIWPFTISIAVLAAIGVDALMIHYQRDKYVRPRRRPDQMVLPQWPGLFPHDPRGVSVLAGCDHPRRVVCVSLDLPNPIDCICRQSAAIDGAGQHRV